MAESTISFAHPQPLVAQFDLPDLTSDGGLPWLAEADTQLGLCAALAAQVPEWRRGPVRHTRETLVRQRVFQIACGYADQNDADTLRADPLLCHVCTTAAPLASQPTFSRLENAVGARDCYRLSQALFGVHLQERERPARPRHILLDLDWTDDPVHGQQEHSAYHGYFRQQMYFPLLIFDGDTDQLIAAILRPGTVHAGHRIVAVLKRIVPALRQRWPGVTIEIRADSGFALPTLYDYCEAENLHPRPHSQSPPRSWPRRRGNRPRRGRRRCAWPGRPATRPAHGRPSAASSTRLKPCQGPQHPFRGHQPQRRAVGPLRLVRSARHQ